MQHACIALARRGWHVLPVGCDKKPLLKNWPREATTDPERIRAWWGSCYRNAQIGVTTGARSGIVVIDIDPRHDGDKGIAQLESQFGTLPQTITATTPGGGRHYYFCYPTGIEIRNATKLGGAPGVDVRGEGGYVVAPPSIGANGRAYEWTSAIDVAAELPAAWIELLSKKNKPAVDGRDGAAKCGERRELSKKTLDFIVNGASKGTRNTRLFSAACDMRGCGYSVAEAREKLLTIALRCGLNDDEAGATIGSAFSNEREPACPTFPGFQVGAYDPDTGKLILSPSDPLPSARAFLRERFTVDKMLILRFYAGVFFVWRENRYTLLADDELRSILYTFTENTLRPKTTREGRVKLVPFHPTKNKVNNIIDAIKAESFLSAGINPPAWLIDRPSFPSADLLLPFRSGILDIPTRRILAPSPMLFSTSALTYDYTENAPRPYAWIKFLSELWPDDPQSIATLQEWFGYCLTGDTSQQKMLLLLGPKRSGKGTIGRVLGALVGPANVVGPTTSSLAMNFGLQPLIGKALAIVSDARFGGKLDLSTIIERLLCISGEDNLTIPRKYLGDATLKLSTKFMFLANELPRVADTSGALAGRFIVLILRHSFFGREDTELTKKLMGELAGILLWALEGWERLHARGHFVNPESSSDAIQELADLASPVAAFVRDRCVLGPQYEAYIEGLHDEWKEWCEENGRDHPGTRQTFGRDLIAALPGLRRSRPRDGELRRRAYVGIGLRKYYGPGGPQWSTTQPIEPRIPGGF
ncbi:MAG TPA: phage/plasmid primase, P4 family [Phycisphaerae bacterium]|nr:phage/plasmid primase, P4 family [Phycisphaerae bacterium]